MRVEALPASIIIANMQHMSQFTRNNTCLSETLHLSFQYLFENEVENINIKYECLQMK
jgi:hypothetical protein